MRNTAKLAFDMLEKEMDVMSFDETFEIMGGVMVTYPPGDPVDCFFQSLYQSQKDLGLTNSAFNSPENIRNAYDLYFKDEYSGNCNQYQPSENGVDPQFGGIFAKAFMNNLGGVATDSTLGDITLAFRNHTNSGHSYMVDFEGRHGVNVQGVNADGTFNLYDRQQNRQYQGISQSRLGCNTVLEFHKATVPHTEFPHTNYTTTAHVGGSGAHYTTTYA